MGSLSSAGADFYPVVRRPGPVARRTPRQTAVWEPGRRWPGSGQDRTSRATLLVASSIFRWASGPPASIASRTQELRWLPSSSSATAWRALVAADTWGEYVDAVPVRPRSSARYRGPGPRPASAAWSAGPCRRRCRTCAPPGIGIPIKGTVAIPQEVPVPSGPVTGVVTMPGGPRSSRGGARAPARWACPRTGSRRTRVYAAPFRPTFGTGLGERLPYAVGVEVGPRRRACRAADARESSRPPPSTGVERPSESTIPMTTSLASASSPRHRESDPALGPCGHTAGEQVCSA